VNWKGKVIGLLIGLLLRNRIVIVLGLVIGHLYDMGMFSAAASQREPPPGAPALDPYAVLGIRSEASNEELEQAYRRRISEYHPDRVAHAAQEIRDMADERSREINQAYDQIKRQRGP
jgi:preprotein translocase subunit Sec63